MDVIKAIEYEQLKMLFQKLKLEIQLEFMLELKKETKKESKYLKEL